jgi:hypothetical protein
MPVRLATPSDELAITALCTSAFFNEALFGDIMHPRRHQYPDDVRPFWHARTRQFLSEHRNIVIVATTWEDHAEKIVGMATWQHGSARATTKMLRR